MIAFFLGLVFLGIFAVVFYIFYSNHVSVLKAPLTHRKYSWKDVLASNKDLLPAVVLVFVIFLIILVMVVTGVGATESNTYYYHLGGS